MNVSEGQELGVAWLEGSGSRLLGKFLLSVSGGQLSSEGWGGAGRCGFKVVSQSWQASSGCRQETASLLHVGLSIRLFEHLDGMKAGFP